MSPRGTNRLCDKLCQLHYVYFFPSFNAIAYDLFLLDPFFPWVILQELFAGSIKILYSSSTSGDLIFLKSRIPAHSLAFSSIEWMNHPNKVDDSERRYFQRIIPRRSCLLVADVPPLKSVLIFFRHRKRLSPSWRHSLLAVFY